MIFIRYPFHCELKVLDYGVNPVCSELIKNSIESHLGYGEFSLLFNGKQLHDVDVIPNDSTVEVVFLLPGGKGGFGSMLRAIGAQIEKTTNREACRDLSGRRLRDINEEQRLKKWIAKEAEREAEKIKRRQARIERLKSKAPHNFFDFEYEKEISELPDRINDALSEGLQKAKQPNKRPLEKPKLPKKTWLSDDFPASSSDSETDETNAASGSSSPKKPKMAPKDNSSCDSDISESSISYPGSSKDSNFAMDKSSVSSDSKTLLIEKKTEENSIASSAKGKSKENSPLDKADINSEQSLEKRLEHDRHNENPNVIPSSATTVHQSEENKMENSQEEKMETVESYNISSEATSKSDNAKEPETKVKSPINLLDFQNVKELEDLGLDKLKSALMERGLKCGGTLSDRAQRLWSVRSLQPHEYPAKLLAKNKK